MKKKLMKSKYDRKLCGVCGGIAEYFGIDSTLVRVIWLLLSLSPPGFIFYFICAVVIPDQDDTIEY